MSSVPTNTSPVNDDRLGTLVLSRRLDQSISIGKDCVIRVVHVGRSRVKLAITAPRERRILRTELMEVQP
ncbi:MAG TPA: carbon storage regulator [Planctomycetota bacterium]|nr:carbon storage regulator [Planctomycetota bacterium]